MFDRIKSFLYQAGFIFVLPLRVLKAYSVLSITARVISSLFCYQFVSGSRENFFTAAIKLLSFTIYEFINNIAENSFFGKTGLDKFETRDRRGMEISGSAVSFLSLCKSGFKLNLARQPLW